MAALDGLRVVEFGHYIAGPNCAQALAVHGAEVVKVEPLHGDPCRHAGPLVGDASPYFAGRDGHPDLLGRFRGGPAAR